MGRVSLEVGWLDHVESNKVLCLITIPVTHLGLFHPVAGMSTFMRLYSKSHMSPSIVLDIYIFSLVQRQPGCLLYPV